MEYYNIKKLEGLYIGRKDIVFFSICNFRIKRLNKKLNYKKVGLV